MSKLEAAVVGSGLFAVAGTIFGGVTPALCGAVSAYALIAHDPLLVGAPGVGVGLAGGFLTAVISTISGGVAAAIGGIGGLILGGVGGGILARNGRDRVISAGGLAIVGAYVGGIACALTGSVAGGVEGHAFIRDTVVPKVMQKVEQSSTSTQQSASASARSMISVEQARLVTVPGARALSLG